MIDSVEEPLFGSFNTTGTAVSDRVEIRLDPRCLCAFFGLFVAVDESLS